MHISSGNATARSSTTARNLRKIWKESSHSHETYRASVVGLIGSSAVSKVHRAVLLWYHLQHTPPWTSKSFEQRKGITKPIRGSSMSISPSGKPVLHMYKILEPASEVRLKETSHASYS